MFTEHPHLLVAALSALKAAKSVLSSMREEKVTLKSIKQVSQFKNN